MSKNNQNNHKIIVKKLNENATNEAVKISPFLLQNEGRDRFSFTFKKYILIVYFVKHIHWFLVNVLSNGKDNLNGLGFKVNSVQKACAKRFAVHMLKFEILKMT